MVGKFYALLEGSSYGHSMNEIGVLVPDDPGLPAILISKCSLMFNVGLTVPG